MRALLIVALLFCVLPSAAAERPIAIFSQPVPLDPHDPTRVRVGQLVFRGGLALRSPDPQFGGFSALHVASDGATLLAISDRGAWLTLSLDYEEGGRLIGVRDASLGRLNGENGRALTYRDTDAEALAVLPDGSMLVAFERNHRILHYPAASPPFSKPPRRFPTPARIERAPANLGLEALAHVGDGVIVAISEFLIMGDGSLSAWVGGAGGWEPFSYVTIPGFRVSDAGVLPSGGLLVLEHHYNFLVGNVARLVHVPRGAIVPHGRVVGREIALLKPPVTTEIFEGVSTRRGSANEALVYMISDDNFDPRQRTLLLMFSLQEDEASLRPR